MADTTPAHFRIPVDVLGPAKARAAREHRTLTDVVVRYLRDYGADEPAPAVKPKRPARASKPATTRPGPTAAALAQERARDRREDDCPHTYPDVRDVMGTRVCRKCD